MSGALARVLTLAPGEALRPVIRCSGCCRQAGLQATDAPATCRAPGAGAAITWMIYEPVKRVLEAAAA